MKKEKKITEENVKEKKTKKEKISEKKEALLKIIEEKQAIEEKIDALIKDKKATKDKVAKKEIKREIKKLKIERNEVGKKDTYLRDVKKEMRMVRWPSAKEVVKYSIASLVFVAFFALFFYGIDLIFAFVKGLLVKGLFR